MVTRRAFFAYTGGTTLALCLRPAGAHGERTLLATLPGGSLDPRSIPQFQTPLLIPPVMPKAGSIVLRGGKNADYYEISMRQFSQQMLPAGLPPTTVWGYGAVASESKNGLLLHNAPSLTIEASHGKPVTVKWINELKDASGRFLPHLLPVDPSLHWANVPQWPGMDGQLGPDRRPDLRGKTYVPLSHLKNPAKQYTRYTGPVPIVTHVHGAVGVGDESDGYAEAWYLPDANDLPGSYAQKGTWYDFFRAKAQANHGVSWGKGYATFTYPNLGRASADWYHDHALGMTRLNVYAGPAGFFIIRGGPSGDDGVTNKHTGAVAILPGPAPAANDMVPPKKTYYEIALAIQDRSFNADGSLFYPDSRAFFDGIEGPYLPKSDLSPIWNPEFFGNTIIVNGNTWPYLDVEQRRYRFRVLNGCQSRFLILDFSSIPGVEVWQIGNEGGFLQAPVNLSVASAHRLLMGPAERADLIVDFARVPLGAFSLRNVGPDEPFGGGEPPDDFDTADPHTTGQVMQFRVGPSYAADPTTPPNALQLPTITPLPAASYVRRLALLEEMSQRFEDAPAAAMLGTVEGDPASGAGGRWTKRMWADPVGETPAVGATEVWEFYNATADAHPMHVHEVVFQVVNRQDLIVDEENETVRLVPGTERPAEPWESGFKDTVIAYPGQVTRIRARFATPGQFVWHCHIVEHEDNEMMRPYRIGPPQPGQPGPV
jgi:spore coat protein A